MEFELDVKRLIQKTRRYEFADGLRDLQLAVIIGLCSLMPWLAFQPFWVKLIVTNRLTYGRWAALLGLLPMVLMLLLAWITLRLMDLVRERWLWLDSGSVKPSRWIVPRRVNVVSAVIFLAALGISYWFRNLGWFNSDFVIKMIWTATGLSFGYTLVGVGRHLGLPRYTRLGIAGGLLSSLILFLPLSFAQSALMFGLTWFILLMASGLFTMKTVVEEKKRGQSGG